MTALEFYIGDLEDELARLTPEQKQPVQKLVDAARNVITAFDAEREEAS